MAEEGAQCCKVVLLGESGVGKTCIISRYINDTFDENGMSTTGASYVGKNMTFDEYGGRSIKFDIWDTAGQEKYRALTKIFYKDASIAILVYLEIFLNCSLVGITYPFSQSRIVFVGCLKCIPKCFSSNFIDKRTL